MRILIYLLSILVFWGVFELGSQVIQHSREWSLMLAPRSTRKEALRKSFFLSGKIMQIIAVIWGFLDIVAVLVLLAEFAS